MGIETNDLWDLIQRRAELTPDAEMLVDEQGRRFTFLEYKLASEEMAAGFHELGVSEGDVVAWELPTWIETVILAAALSRLGAIQNPIIAIYREREVGFCVKQAKASFLVTPEEYRGFHFGKMAEKIASSIDGLTALAVEPDNFPSGDPEILPTYSLKEDNALRWLCYTSGTTSDPKGAKHTDASIAAIGESMGERLDVQFGDRPALVFPFPHIGGLTWLFTALQAGATLICDGAFDPVTTTELLSREGCTHPGAGTPFHMAYLNAQRGNPTSKIFPNVKNFPGGGAPKPPTLHAEVKRELGGSGIVSGWGLTEAPILTMGANTDPDEKLSKSEGRAMPGVDLIAVKGDGTIANPGEEGELRAKAPQLMLGYLDASLDSEAFDENGYFRTGDLGVIDADGYVVISGRLKDIIIRHGENISAKEVEDLLFNHPQINDVAVIGLPDTVTGERACAVVSLVDDQTLVNSESIRAYLEGCGLRKNAIPEQLEVVDLIPRNPSGKITKNILQEQFKDKPFER
ncbi:MAG: cyclohexanecarboxylate-CoA ligase [Acidimicrobiaceae bacterium]|nr:cyclohexanecarboxylate-CoA ligase [Acidimicrobiaceae bacterium]